MKIGDWPEEVILNIDELAAILFEYVTRRQTNAPEPVTILVESNGKKIMAINYEFEDRSYRSVSCAQITHWKGMNNV